MSNPHNQIEAILVEVLSPELDGQLNEKTIEAIDLYRRTNKLLERTYKAMGKQSTVIYSTKSSTDGIISTRGIFTTAKVPLYPRVV
ncbi:MAG: hypothetical protein R2787_00545 [Saprospiraceae bacterium]